MNLNLNMIGYLNDVTALLCVLGLDVLAISPIIDSIVWSEALNTVLNYRLLAVLCCSVRSLWKFATVSRHPVKSQASGPLWVFFWLGLKYTKVRTEDHRKAMVIRNEE